MKFKSIKAFFIWEIYKVIRPLLNWFDKKMWMPVRVIDTNRLFLKFGNDCIFFIQVGANDGVTGDNLHHFIKKYNWAGILVEPVPYIYRRLKNNYSDCPGLIFENSAIGKENKLLPFYSITEANDKGIKHKDVLKDHGLDQLGSFDKKTLLKHAAMIPDFESYIKEINVPTMTITELILRYSVQKIDLLQIDTEGYDFEIVNNLKLETLHPKILIFEHVHLSRSNYKKLIKKLDKKYDLFINARDTICLSKESINQSDRDSFK